MREQIQNIKIELNQELDNISGLNDLKNSRIKFLGRKSGSITRLLGELLKLDLQQKREYGPDLTELKHLAESAFDKKEKELQGISVSGIDITLPGKNFESGHLHAVTLVQKKIHEAFSSLGFDIHLAPEIETDFYNFEALNIPEFHPARDMQDTFYLDLPLPQAEPGKNVLLRTHISNLQVRYMQKHKPPFAVIGSGKVYRNEALDASHEHTYSYTEGFAVGENMNYASMAWTLEYAMRFVFGPDIKIRLVPSYFPFVEPGAEMGISCMVCKGRGCAVCKQTGWVEILGCGMIHQNVFQNAGYKKGQYQGFAFGFGVSRLTIMKYQIPDIRLLTENDLRFLKQF